MPTTENNKLRVSSDTGVTTITIDNPPVNILDFALMSEFRTVLMAVRRDVDTRVIVFESADPEFFISHVDMTLGEQPDEIAGLQQNLPDGLNPFQAFNEMLRAQPQVTIVKLAGLARGGGAEFVAAVDMAFAAEGRAGLAQCEALMGIIPGGGATQYLGRHMTRGRVLEAVLGADLFDARLAERYGWVNRALPAKELDAFVDNLARNIAALPQAIIAAVKSAVPPADFAEGFRRESEAWMSLVTQPHAGQVMMEGLKAGAQTRRGELDLESLLRGVSERVE